MMTEKIITKSGLQLFIEKRGTEKEIEVSLQTQRHEGCLLHWGLGHHLETTWQIPPEALWPQGSKAFDKAAVQTPFIKQNGGYRILFRLDRALDFSLIVFVLFFPEKDCWDNNQGRNYQIEILKSSLRPVHALKKVIKQDEISYEHVHHLEKYNQPADFAKEIIEKEMNSHSWTLMHRFNLCFDLLDKIRNGVQALALIFIWLRFSAVRQLDWQRNYNTQPRELSNAQDRLTHKLAERYVNVPEERQVIRLILITLGRGGEGQRIRDEILNIMHRHHIKEVSGHFMEEWHQKLHNNTTPDDVVICEAYLAFLKENGNLDMFYRRLEHGGVTKERLQSYDRPIRSHPDFIPHLKDALIHDFEAFLGILKKLHTGTDLGTAIYSARYLLDPYMNELMDFIWRHRDDGPEGVCTLVGKITEARKRLTEQLPGPHGGVRDLLFLDLALEDFLRVVVERSLHLKLNGDQLMDLIAMMVENRSLTDDDEELSQCLRQWKILKHMPRFGKKWSLQAKAVLDRLCRVIGDFIDHYYLLLQSKAEFLGNAFRADPWTITLFTEEVVRGRPAFVLVMLLRHLDYILRRNADLGNWQVVSRGSGMGQVEVVADLRSVQGRSYNRSTVIVTDKIAGDEEIPQGITAIITPDTTDIVSHVAIRARNARVLIATCYDLKTVDLLKSLSGQIIKLNLNAAGEVVIEKGSEETGLTWPRMLPARIPTFRPGFTDYAVSEKDFNAKNVGGKSNNLKRLRTKAPEWIDVPCSVAVPFGVFERVLSEEKNSEIAGYYEEMIKNEDQTSDASRSELLGELRKTVLALKSPDELVSCLYRVMEEAGLAWPGNWDDAWMCIKRVWGSKWNERAFLSRRAQGISHEDLFMAVLIQEVVEADYSFVIHTVNPFTGERDEIYAEVVLGLGETLVGNYPGRAFSFASRKGENKPHVLAFPSKSAGLFGSGLIFRSDSNGEDLIDYAGAGLYDSVMLTPPRKIALDYSAEPLISDERFQRHFLAAIANIGTVIEKNMGSPQDIEGAYAKDRYYVVQTRPQVGK